MDAGVLHDKAELRLDFPVCLEGDDTTENLGLFHLDVSFDFGLTLEFRDGVGGVGCWILGQVSKVIQELLLLGLLASGPVWLVVWQFDVQRDAL